MHVPLYWHVSSRLKTMCLGCKKKNNLRLIEQSLVVESRLCSPSRSPFVPLPLVLRSMVSGDIVMQYARARKRHMQHGMGPATGHSLPQNASAKVPWWNWNCICRGRVGRFHSKPVKITPLALRQQIGAPGWPRWHNPWHAPTTLCCRGELDLQIRLQNLLPIPNSSKAEALDGLDGLF